MGLIVIIYVFAYELGPGPIGYIYVNDICEDAGTSFGTFGMWLFILLTIIISPFLIFN